MADNKLNLSTNNLIMCAVYAIIGLLLIILQGGSLGILFTIIGVLFILLGVVDIVNNKDTTKGVIEIAVGAIVLLCGWLIAEIVLLILGVVLIVYGIMEISKNYKSGFMAILSPIITIIIGVLLVIAKWALLDVFCIIAGVIFLINAVLVLFDKGVQPKTKTTKTTNK